MNIDNIIINIIISVVGGAAAGFGVFKWLGKKWISNWFAKDLKKYEHQLELLKMQKQLQYSNVYVKRAEAIRNLYQSIFDLSYEIKHFTDGCTEYSDYHDRLNNLDSIKSLINKIERLCGINKIYFTDTTNTKITKYSNYLQEIHNDLEKNDNEEDNFAEEFEYYSARSAFLDSLNHQYIKDLSDELINEFRNLIGVEKE